MPMYLLDHELHTFTRFEAKPDPAKPGFYSGVIIAEKGPAKGHFAVKESNGRVVNYDRDNPEHLKAQKFQIVIGEATLDDLVKSAALSDLTKCKLDHGGTVKDIVGDYCNFHRDGDKVRADLTLDSRFQSYNHTVALIERMAKKIGNSIDFDYLYEIKGDEAVARVVKLNSVDIVDAPAATSSLFNEQTNPPDYMPLTPEDLAAITGVVQTAVETRFGAMKTDLDARFSKLETKLEEGDDEETEEEKKKRKEKEEKEKEGDGDSKMSAIVNKAILSSMKTLFPAAKLESLGAAPAPAPAAGGEYDTKFSACKEMGMSDGQAARHIASKFPALHNAKFGALVATNTRL